MLAQIKKLFFSTRFLVILYAMAAALVAWLQFSAGPKPDTMTHYNNYIIFRQSFFHLVQLKDLYQLHPSEHSDYYKYSPTFALLMGILAYLPIFPGYLLWILLNAMILFVAIRTLPVNDPRFKVYILWFIVIDLITSLQNSQSNALMAGLLILAFCLLERKNFALATLMISLTVFIKIFGLVAFSLFFLYPVKKKFIFYSALWMVMLLILPLIVISPSQLIYLYKSWWGLLSADYSASIGYSVMGWFHTWFHFDPPKNLVVLSGAVIFYIPLLFVKRYGQFIFRLLFLCNILIWVIIFNHRAESSTFIIAVCGIGMWYFSQEKNYFNLILLLFAFIFTCLSPTDVFPSTVRNNFFQPYVLKVVPCILIWVKIIYELVSASYKPKSSLITSSVSERRYSFS